MIRLLGFIGSKNKKRDLKIVTQKQLQKNMEVIKSLRDYDQGKKDIPTHNVQGYLPGIRVTPK